MKFETAPSKEIAHEELSLRLIDQSDAGNLLRLTLDPDTTRFVPWVKYVQDRESAERQVRIFQDQYESGRFARYAIYCSNDMAGYIGVWPTEEAQTYEIGFAIYSEFRGRGLASQATRMIEQELLSRGAEKIVGHVNDANLSSARVLEKCGFTRTDNYNFDNERRYEKRLD